MVTSQVFTRYKLLAQIMYDEMLIMRINPFRVPWITWLRRTLNRKAKEGRSEKSSFRKGSTQEYLSPKLKEIFEKYDEDELGIDRGSSIDGHASESMSWLQKVQRSGNILPTLQEFERDTMWIHILSARCVRFMLHSGMFENFIYTCVRCPVDSVLAFLVFLLI